jgi:hypothetical protein
MFKNCSELLAVDFGNKRLGAVTDAEDMFAGCNQLTTLICPPTSTWKADLNFEDCPLLTTESVYSLIDYLFLYESGTHTITFNQTMWDALDPAVQTDIETKANAKGWQISMAAAYFIAGTSSASVVYATIDGSAVEIDVENGAFSYGYRSPITSISFEGDTNVTGIDFSQSDGLAGLTSMDNAFKNCSSLVSVNFTNCDISNVVSASDCFANCAALTNLTIPTGIWKPDVDFSTCPLIVYAEMQDIINSLYTYTSGTHTITFNQTTWDSLSVAQQQTIFDAAQLKGWTTNAVMVVYVIRGTSTNVNGTESFTIQFIDDGALSPSAAETITCAVDGSGNWEYQYYGKKIYSLSNAWKNNTTITSIDFSASDDLLEVVDILGAFEQTTALTTINFSTHTLENVINAERTFNNATALSNISMNNVTLGNATNTFALFNGCTSLLSISMPNATFDSTTDARQLVTSSGITNLTLPKATFRSLASTYNYFANINTLTEIHLPLATFENVTDARLMFFGMRNIEEIDLPSATFEKVTTARQMFNGYSNSKLKTINIPSATFELLTDAYAMFIYDALITINMPSATFESVTTTTYILADLKNLTTINVPQGTFPITFGFTRSNSGIALTYQSMVNVANWCKDLIGGTAQTLTLNATAFNGLTSAEQATIQGILSGKNWNLATA